MASSILARLRVILTAESDDFKRGMDDARKRLGSLSKDFDKFRNNTLANLASFGVFANVLKDSLNAASEYDNAQRQLAATSKLTGASLGFLQQTSQAAQDQFKLSAVSANQFTIEMSKLAAKAGDMGKAGKGLEAFLNIGAARGLSAEQTLEAVKQSILGIDEGTDKLFSKNPSVLYAEYAKKIGTTAGALTDQQKAQALLDAALRDGEKVRGSYSEWLGSSQGQQYLLSQGMEQTKVVLGKALQPALVAVLPVIAKMAEGVQMAIRGWQMLGATLALVPAMFSAAKLAITGHLSEAKKEMGYAVDAWRDSIAEIQASGIGAVKVPAQVAFTPPSQQHVAAQAKKTVKAFVSEVAKDWEDMKYSVLTTRLQVTGTDTDRLAAEEAHELRLLDLEEQQARVKAQTDATAKAQLPDQLKELATRRQIVQERRREMEAAMRENAAITAGYERQSILLADATEWARMLGSADLDRLRDAGTIDQRLAAQLRTAEELYRIERDGILENNRLRDEERENQLLQLDLAHEREAAQLRLNAAIEKEGQRREKHAKLKGDVLSLSSDILGGMLTGNHMSGAEIGSAVGSMIPGLGPFGSMLGGVLGGLFDKHKNDAPQPVVKALEAIERAQKETMTSIQAQTEALLKPEDRLLNLPSSFSVPAYNPGGSSVTNVRQGDTNVTVHLTVQSAESPAKLRDVIASTMADILYDQRRLSRV